MSQLPSELALSINRLHFFYLFIAILIKQKYFICLSFWTNKIEIEVILKKYYKEPGEILV